MQNHFKFLNFTKTTLWLYSFYHAMWFTNVAGEGVTHDPVRHWRLWEPAQVDVNVRWAGVHLPAPNTDSATTCDFF